MCCMQLAENTGCKKSPSVHHRTMLSDCMFATKACINNQKKNLLNSNISSTCPHNTVNFRPLTAEIDWRVFGAPQQISTVSCLGFVTAPKSLNGRQPNSVQCLAVSWAGTLYIHFWGLLPSNRILPGAKFTLHPWLVFSYIGSVTARRSSSGTAAIRLGIGPRSS